MEITYSKYGDYLLPDLIVPEEKSYPIGRYGDSGWSTSSNIVECCMQISKSPANCTSILPILTDRLVR